MTRTSFIFVQADDLLSKIGIGFHNEPVQRRRYVCRQMASDDHLRGGVRIRRKQRLQTGRDCRAGGR